MDWNSPSSTMKPMHAFIEKMRMEAVPEAAVETFIRFYRQLESGASSTIPESAIVPVKPENITDAGRLSGYADTGSEALKKTAVLKLNGGLGTTMGLQGPKSLITIKNGYTFLDITIGQITHACERSGFRIPLILMNSFFTDAATRAALGASGNPSVNLVRCIVQHKYPKVLASTLGPAECPSNPSLEWNPPGHGDLFLALETSGTLEGLLNEGYRYLFVSNIDNLGAHIDAGILGYFAARNLDFLMEVTDRTAMDRKGGHLAKLANGRLTLREAAQCAEQDLNAFTDIRRHAFFNTNNLWIGLESARDALRSKKTDGMPPVINRKRLDQLDRSSPHVYHLESALGSAISLFEKSAAVRVSRSRFAPVKNCDELLLVWSDYYSLESDWRIRVNPARKSERVMIALDPAFYSRIDLLTERFPSGAPSLVNCESFSVKGDVRFGRNISIRGAVSISNTASGQTRIDDGTEIANDRTF